MSKSNTKIYRPKKGTDMPDAPAFDPETGAPTKIDKKLALRQWLSAAKADNKTEEESYNVSIDPKQAFYARKTKKED